MAALGLIPWLGGKHRFAPWLAAQLPPHRVYIEPFGGSAAVLLARATPAPVEIYNDLDDGLVTLFRVLRDPNQFAEFYRRAQLLPYSRVEYLRCRATGRESDDPIERALRWYAVARWSYSGHWGHGWGADWAMLDPRFDPGASLPLSQRFEFCDEAINTLAHCLALISKTKRENRNG